MWNFASNALSGTNGLKNDLLKPNQAPSECSDDEISTNTSREEGLECPICWESFNIVENVPYVLWCGHTLCKNCVLGLQWAVVKFPTLPIQLPFFISCPWCNLLSFRLVYKGNLTFPRKNFFLLWMVESMNGDRGKSHSSFCDLHIFPLVIIFLLIVLYAIPASAAILALYILITVLFALPSFLILYFAYPSLDWLVREIIT
ncbi:unnamed protein product, partial [Vitis vinifera]